MQSDEPEGTYLHTTNTKTILFFSSLLFLDCLVTKLQNPDLHENC